MSVYRSLWQDNFPDTIIDQSLGSATSHPQYLAAKSGNVEAAYELVTDLVSEKAINELNQLANGQSAILVPVHAEESLGRNMIPLATAFLLSEKLGFAVDLNVVQASKVSRTQKDGWYRLLHSPCFDGKITSNLPVIMLDDTQTQGGTFASLKGHIEHFCSNQVIGAYALTGKQYSKKLRLETTTLTQLREQYATIEPLWRQRFGYGFDRLTEWEAKYLLNAHKSVEQVTDIILTSE